MDATLTRTFAALGDPVRSTIVDRLAQSDATVGELVAMFDISFQAVSQHLGVLEDARIITRHRAGRTRRAHLETQQLDAAIGWMEARRRRLEERYRRLDDLLERMPDDPTTSTSTGTAEGATP
jgi:DNA-binding transcriptional ArsR family regulator